MCLSCRFPEAITAIAVTLALASLPAQLTAQTWKTEGAIDQPVPVKAYLATGFAKLKPR